MLIFNILLVGLFLYLMWSQAYMDVCLTYFRYIPYGAYNTTARIPVDRLNSRCHLGYSGLETNFIKLLSNSGTGFLMVPHYLTSGSLFRTIFFSMFSMRGMLLSIPIYSLMYYMGYGYIEDDLYLIVAFIFYFLYTKNLYDMARYDIMSHMYFDTEIMFRYKNLLYYKSIILLFTTANISLILAIINTDASIINSYLTFGMALSIPYLIDINREIKNLANIFKNSIDIVI